MIVGSAKECRRDLEAEAKRLKEKINSFSWLFAGMGDFWCKGHLCWLDNYDDKRSFLAIYGALSFELPAMQEQYDRILEEMEKEK